jgi:hypothetical protein
MNRTIDVIVSLHVRAQLVARESLRWAEVAKCARIRAE